ncbi:MAG: PAS domain-containing protein [Candidatus Latescibacteria bacterium]|nr:PAS domain-containing protein [Candidatus Latescibacterota bacterium]
MNTLSFAAGDLFEALPLPATLVDREGRIAGINQAFLDYARQHGRNLRLEDRLGFHLLDFAGKEEEYHLMQGLLQAVLEEGRESVFSWASPRTSGGRRIYVEVRARPVRDREGRVAGALILREDTTELRHQEEQLELVTARYQSLSAIPYFVVMLWDQAGNFLYISPHIQDWIGLSAETLRAEPALGWQRVHPEDLPALQNAQERAMAGQVLRDIEFRYQGKVGEYRWASGVFYPLTGPQGMVYNLQAVFQDITERKRTEEDRAQLEAQLHQVRKLEAVGQLSAGVAHNFNNILQVIMGNIELALMDAPESLRFPLQEAELATRQGAEVVRQLSAFTRPARRSHRTPVDLRGVVDRIAARCRQTFDPRIILSVDAPPSLVIAGEAGPLEQAGLNLCLNARDAMEETRPSSPLIHIALRRVEEAELEQPVPPEAGPGPYAQLQIADNGAGMDEAVRERIFEPFFTTKEVGKGTGLGLATAYGIVREHQGWIECQSAPGAGACFWIYLPLGHPRPEQLPAPPEGQTVLLVEDEAVVRETVAQLLKRAGYRVLEAGDGVEGLELFGQVGGQVDLVILDLAMPRLSGEQVLERLGELAPHLKILLFTGYGEGWEGRPQVVEVLHKPLQFAEILQAVRRALDPRNG